MQYRHITLNISLEGLSPKKVISDLGKEGFEPLYSKMTREFCLFLCRQDAFDEYTKIKTRISPEEEQERNKIRDALSAEATMTDYNRFELERQYSKLHEPPLSFGDLFKNKKFPTLIFSLVDSSSASSNQKGEIDWEPELWFSCWDMNNDQKHQNIQEALECFVTSVLKVIGCDRCTEEITKSDTFSLAHQQMMKRLSDYNLKQASFDDKKKLVELISDSKLRTILIEFNKKTGILLSDFLGNTELEAEDATNKLNFLTGQGLLEKNLVVICKKTNQWWNMAIPSKEMLSEVEKAGITCTSCGAKISEEKIDTLFKISQKGTILISGSLWMVGKIVESLRQLGCRDEDIFADIMYDGDQIDVMALVLGACLAFELKDREFGLGDAYKFHGKVSRLRQKASPVIPIVVTTKTIASEARKLLSEVTARNPFDREHIDYQLIEGLDDLEPKIREVLDKKIGEITAKRIADVDARFPAKLLAEQLFIRSR